MSEHPSGVICMAEFKVLVRPDPVLTRTKGGIEIPEAYQKKFEVHTGTLEMISDDAFSFHTDANARRPKVGDRVLMGRYAGVELSGKHTKDGNEYRIINDKDILCVIGF